MKVTIKFLILLFLINVDINFITCYANQDLTKNYDLTGIGKECFQSSNFNSALNINQGSTIIIENSSAHILYPDSSTFKMYSDYNRMDCEFTVKAQQNYEIIASIQQMNFDDDCQDYVQFKNQHQITQVCGKFGQKIYEIKFLKDSNSADIHPSRRELIGHNSKINVKISVRKSHLHRLRYLLIAFTAVKKELSSSNKNENFYLASKYNCDGIKNFYGADDENNCDEQEITSENTTIKNDDQIKKNETIETIFSIIGWIFLVVFFVLLFYFSGRVYCVNSSNQPRRNNQANIASNNNNTNLTTRTSSSVNIVSAPPVPPAPPASISLAIDRDPDLPTYESLYPEICNQANVTSANQH